MDLFGRIQNSEPALQGDFERYVGWRLSSTIVRRLDFVRTLSPVSILLLLLLLGVLIAVTLGALLVYLFVFLVSLPLQTRELVCDGVHLEVD